MTAEQIGKWVRDQSKTFGLPPNPYYYEHGVDPEGVRFTRLVTTTGEVVVPPFITSGPKAIVAR